MSIVERLSYSQRFHFWYLYYKCLGRPFLRGSIIGGSTVVFFSFQEYEEAERCVDRVLQMEPTNRQANQLKKLIVKKIRKGKTSD